MKVSYRGNHTDRTLRCTELHLQAHDKCAPAGQQSRQRDLFQGIKQHHHQQQGVGISMWASRISTVWFTIIATNLPCCSVLKHASLAVMGIFLTPDFYFLEADFNTNVSSPLQPLHNSPACRCIALYLIADGFYNHCSCIWNRAQGACSI